MVPARPVLTPVRPGRGRARGGRSRPHGLAVSAFKHSFTYYSHNEPALTDLVLTDPGWPRGRHR